MSDPIEELVTKLLDADAKMTKGPWAGTATLDNDIVLCALPDEINVLCEPHDLRQYLSEDAGLANVKGIALLRNTAPVVAKVIRELTAELKSQQEAWRFIKPQGKLDTNLRANKVADVDNCLARVAKLIEEHNDDK